ncbi:hypothetical protein QZH41_009824 [Actinostola sp. cb2023]|nr:hypothetical protein QZH41_009824 [Actinostola sp. cb2023]
MPGYVLLDTDKEGIPKKYLCSFCGLLLRDARQTLCGHFYCDLCVASLAIDSTLTCLEDNEVCPLDQVYPDNFVRREVLSLVVRCKNAENGCKWRGEVRHMVSHAAECEFQKVKCMRPGCDVMLLRQELPNHLETECQYRTTPCTYCSKEVAMADMKKHHNDECMKFPTACPKCKMEGISREMMPVHLDPLRGDCSELEGPCPFSTLGCSVKEVMNKDRRAKHMNDSTAWHLSLLQKDYVDLKDRVATQSAVPQSHSSPPLMTYPEGQKDQMVNNLVVKVEALMKENVNMRRQIAEQTAQLLDMERRLASASDIEVPTFSLSPLNDKDSSEFLKDLRKRVTNVENRVAQFQVHHVDNMQRMNDQTDSIAEVKHEVEETVAAQRAMDTRLFSQETATAMNSVAMADMEDVVSDLSLATYDGILIWKISEVARRRTDCVNGRDTSFYSHPFYSKRQGYKMCARIYLNGDGMGRGNSISLFFVVMRGEHDALLRWPFREKVTLMLLDQDNIEHVIDAFRPDPTSTSFQRPRAKMNIASGCPMFCPLSELVNHAYIRDDALFIKVIVDTIDS